MGEYLSVSIVQHRKKQTFSLNEEDGGLIRSILPILGEFCWSHSRLGRHSERFFPMKIIYTDSDSFPFCSR